MLLPHARWLPAHAYSSFPPMSIAEVISSQRAERDQLLSRPYQARQTRYDVALLLSAGEIKLITGPRRAGKSTMALLMLRDRPFAYLNFDDGQLLDGWEEASVMAALERVYPGYEYLLLDEVQNLPSWDLWVSKLYRRGVRIVITGSNARMLSSEMATVLTGRYLPVEILPLSLGEVLQWRGLSAADGAVAADVEAVVDDYLRWGGYPETVGSRAMAATYLSTLFEAIVLKDMAVRHRVRHATDLTRMALFLLANIGRPMSYHSLAQAIGLSSVNTVKRYVGYMCEPFLFFLLPRYDKKLRLQQRAQRKVYVADNGFVSARAFRVSEDRGRLLENQVFIELLRRGYSTEQSLFYYHTHTDKEVDFVLRRGTQVEQLLQVCYDLSTPKARKREVDALVEGARELGCDALTIITYGGEASTLVQGGYTVRVRPVLAWQCEAEQ